MVSVNQKKIKNRNKYKSQLFQKAEGVIAPQTIDRLKKEKENLGRIPEKQTNEQKKQPRILGVRPLAFGVGATVDRAGAGGVHAGFTVVDPVGLDTLRRRVLTLLPNTVRSRDTEMERSNRISFMFKRCKS